MNDEARYYALAKILEYMERQNVRIEAKLDQLLAKKKPKPRASKTDGYGPAFNKIWDLYPKRPGNSKSKAFAAYNQRIKDAMKIPVGTPGNNVQWLMLEGVKRYADFCDATGKTGTEYTKMAATFFGPDKHYENDWTIPAKAEKIPADNDDMVDWAHANGFRDPKIGESYFQFRKALEAWGRS